MGAGVVAIGVEGAAMAGGVLFQGGNDVGSDAGAAGATAVAVDDLERRVAIPEAFAERLFELVERLGDGLATVGEVDDQRLAGADGGKIEIALRAGGLLAGDREAAVGAFGHREGSCWFLVGAFQEKGEVKDLGM